MATINWNKHLDHWMEAIGHRIVGEATLMTSLEIVIQEHAGKMDVPLSGEIIETIIEQWMDHHKNASPAAEEMRTVILVWDDEYPDPKLAHAANKFSKGVPVTSLIDPKYLVEHGKVPKEIMEEIVHISYLHLVSATERLDHPDRENIVSQLMRLAEDTGMAIAVEQCK